MEHGWNDNDMEKTTVLLEKPFPVALSIPQIPQGLNWNKTQGSMVRDQ